MNTTVLKSKISGIIPAPTSKSALQRYIVGAMLAEGKSKIRFETLSDDSLNLVKIANQLTHRAKIIDKTIEIEGGLLNIPQKINVGESGLALRMLIAILASQNSMFEISAQGSLLNRPIDFIIESIKQLGVRINSTDGKLPIILQGNIKKSSFTIDGSLSSQLLSGLLFATPLLEQDTVIFVDNLKSKPYIDLTISILNKFGINIINDNYSRFFIDKKQEYKSIEAQAEGDWSGIAFMLVAAAICGEITVEDINSNSKQGDKNIVELLRQVGATVLESPNKITITTNKLNAFKFNATDMPDLFPPLVALAVNCSGISEIKGVSRLLHKESNRAFTLKNEFEKLGAIIDIADDCMIIKGCKLKGNKVYSHNDHRIAMSLAIAGLNSAGETTIEKSEAVAKSWTDFFRVLKQVGAYCY